MEVSAGGGFVAQLTNYGKNGSRVNGKVVMPNDEQPELAQVEVVDGSTIELGGVIMR